MKFLLFSKFLFDEVETMRQNFQNYLNPKLVIGSILENGFGATLR